jgi:hypothetical protein
MITAEIDIGYKYLYSSSGNCRRTAVNLSVPLPIQYPTIPFSVSNFLYTAIIAGIFLLLIVSLPTYGSKAV